MLINRMYSFLKIEICSKRGDPPHRCGVHRSRHSTTDLDLQEGIHSVYEHYLHRSHSAVGIKRSTEVQVTAVAERVHIEAHALNSQPSQSFTFGYFPHSASYSV